MAKTKTEKSPLKKVTKSTVGIVNQKSSMTKVTKSKDSIVNQKSPLKKVTQSKVGTVTQKSPLKKVTKSKDVIVNQKSPLKKVTQSKVETVNQNSPLKKVTQSKVETVNKKSPLKKVRKSKDGVVSQKSPLKKVTKSKDGIVKKSPFKRFAAHKTDPLKNKSKKQQLKLALNKKRGVVYFSHLPHGFYQQQLNRYCSQFGTVTGVYLPRSVNGNPKGYGFVEFKHPEVADVVAETMNNYLMFNRLIKAQVIPPEKQKPWIFRTAKASAAKAKKKLEEAHAARERILTPEEEEAYKKKAECRVRKLKNKLEKQGINYEFTVAS